MEYPERIQENNSGGHNPIDDRNVTEIRVGKAGFGLLGMCIMGTCKWKMDFYLKETSIKVEIQHKDF